MNCKNFSEAPARPRKYNADCDTSILQVDLMADRPASKPFSLRQLS